MKYLIDTDIASYFLRGKYNLIKTFEKKDSSNLRLSIITIAQLEVLAYRNPYSKINLATIGNLVQRMGVLDIDRQTWKIFSQTKAETLKTGKTRGDLDILQASIAKQHDLIVVTHNTSHYQDIVGWEDWTTG